MTADAGSEIPRTMAAVRRGFDQRLHVAAQVYVSRGGRIVADVAVGETEAGVPMRSDDSMPWLSADKPITVVAIAQPWERGLLDLDDRVAAHIPEFGAGGKEAITIRHLLTHTGGFRAVLGDYENQSWDKLIGILIPRGRGWMARSEMFSVVYGYRFITSLQWGRAGSGADGTNTTGDGYRLL